MIAANDRRTISTLKRLLFEGSAIWGRSPKNSALSKTAASIETDSLISFTGRLGVLLLLSSSALQCNQDMLRGIVPDSSVALVR
jgi:hypothetical protein